jgi:hypothetical protein
MLKFPVIDKVQIHTNLPDLASYQSALAALYWTAESHGVPSKLVKNPYSNGRYVKIMVVDKELEIATLLNRGRYWLMYRFNGLVNTWEFKEATNYFGAYDFEHALLHGRVKRLELALDIVNQRPNDYIYHFQGSRVGHVYERFDGADDTFYVGSRDSQLQLIAYDKARHLLEKKGYSQFSRLLRIELRIQDRKESLDEVIAKLMLDSPFDRVMVLSLSDAIHFKTGIKDWGLFVSACRAMGVPKALQHFPVHAKTFLKYLRQLSLPRMCPNSLMFRKALGELLPWKPFWDALDPHISNASTVN